MSRLRQALTFENVLVTVVAFVVLAGGTAIAANQLAKNSVGKKQLKAKSVGAAELKKNAVTTAKIKKGAVTGAKVKDGSLQPADLDLAGMPFAHVVFQATGSSTVPVSASLETPTVYPLENPNYTQEPGRLDTFFGAIDVNFPVGCEAPRVAIAYLLRDAAALPLTDTSNVAAAGQFISATNGAAVERINLSPYGAGIALPGPAATNHNLSIVLAGECKSGGGITAGNAVVQVVGTR